jgi:hypothetical protein
MPSPSRKFYDPIEYALAFEEGTEAERARRAEQNRKLMDEAQSYAERLIRQGHCPYCLTVNCSGHGISE